ncbi:uncharacterized protein DUF2849 [Rhodovulum imhoffii]|uniref:Uncharacterized protein DUF2849 n=1 Tax=Rhodovulum imhoffii TaxID=365340 RepID=A0A2T5BVI6_9RHOB|nr:DUF2849 domain-containing protein [Rhodovulum imhoffii]MBK5932842.1 hypothetical protein [Rhodovulum imhoffii]PTN03589.1 uncharacterized protein DUF2849 [Rhodovulum imhoffii]
MSKQVFSVVTANDLLGGHVVYLSPLGTWVPEVRDAELIPDIARARLRLEEVTDDASVVGVYLAEMLPGPDGPRPMHFREVFRAQGPSAHARVPEVRHV